MSFFDPKKELERTVNVEMTAMDVINVLSLIKTELHFKDTLKVMDEKACEEVIALQAKFEEVLKRLQA